ncbi:MAG: hypothetical protein KatS3mg095_0113 [Candidatus Parcubacteria bacterium]|nr:MAG: hypothetical protein KatS3mg095_0113 [Candidatus Parcubacteria bacterium]
MKARSSFIKRFKITKNKKILRRLSGISHFLAKKSSKLIRRKKRLKISDKLFLDYLKYKDLLSKAKNE